MGRNEFSSPEIPGVWLEKMIISFLSMNHDSPQFMKITSHQEESAGLCIRDYEYP